MHTDYIAIKNDWQIKKFSAYGFFKNLRFFEPYLVLYLLDSGLNLFQIGLLYSIREIIVNVFEIPSGLLADKMGNRKILMACFVFYIFSFILFALAWHFLIFAFAMILFGLGEAFRSGTHKAMIYNYLEIKNWFQYKTFVYGRTRSFSLLGSSLSAIFSILLLLWIKKIDYLFLISIIPYLADFFLILSYPKNLDDLKDKPQSFKDFFISSYHSLIKLFHQKRVLRITNSSALFEAFFGNIKDYIQPILKVVLSSVTLYGIFKMSSDEFLKITLGLSYSLTYILGSMASKNAYKFLGKHHLAYWLNALYLGLSISFLAIAFFIRLDWFFSIILLFAFLYILQNMRRPFFMDLIGETMDKDQRATVLSVENQLTSFYIIFLAPLMGFLADEFGVWKMMILIGLLSLVLFGWIRIKENTN